MLIHLATSLLLAADLGGAPAERPFTLRGTVLDATGAPVAAATVTAVPESRVQGLSTQTDPKGEFTLGLPLGSYAVKVVAAGFKEAWQSVSATAAGTESRQFVLEVPSFRETVTVSAPSAYQVAELSSATRTLTPLRDVPQSVTVATRELMKDQLMRSIGDVVLYVPGIAAHQGENNRDQVIIRGNNSSADFFLNGVRDDVQYYRDLYNLERVEALKGPNAMIFGRGGGGGVINRVTKRADFTTGGEVQIEGGSFSHGRIEGDGWLGKSLVWSHGLGDARVNVGLKVGELDVRLR
jgi:catecholate siderophore receptor